MSTPHPPPSASHPQLPVTELLAELRAGDENAFDALFPRVYDELRGLAHHKLQFERANHTLNTTALVHEAYERLVRQEVAWQNRAHFFAVAAQAMRRILVNYAVKRKAEKRGGGAVPLPLHEAGPIGGDDAVDLDDVLSIDEALRRLEAFNERGCRVIEYHFFGGLTHEEIAAVMGLSLSTVRRAWRAARAWLRCELGEGRT